MRSPQQWARSSGVLFAVFCACLAGILPFAGIAVFSFLQGAGDADDAPLPLPPPPVEMLAPISTVASSAPDPQLMGALTALQADLRQQLQQIEVDRHASQVSLSARMGRLEEGLASRSESGTAAVDIVSQVDEPAGDSLADLGVDWAAWTTGAEIDHQHTSTGLGRHAVGRAARALSVLAPRWRNALEVSQPAEVVLSSHSSPPSRCFSFAGNGTIAIRFAKAVALTHVLVERLPRWATVHPTAQPRFVEVRAQLRDEPGYSTTLASFQYLLEGPRSQAFPVAVEGRQNLVAAVQFFFSGNWGEEFTSVCRLRAMGPPAGFA